MLKWGLTGLAAAILALIVYFFIRLIGQSNPSLSTFGLSFVFGNDWDRPRHLPRGADGGGHADHLGDRATLGVPVAVAAALYHQRALSPPAPGAAVDPGRLAGRGPAVVYGLWGVFVLAPKLLPAEKWFASTFSFIPWLGGGTPTGPNYFIAGLILAIMILPIVSAISREVISTVPAEHKEAALALGATRWEMIRLAVLPYSRPGITGGAMLGLGRAIGETIAVFLVIGGAPTIGSHLFSQGNSLAAVIAAEFGEAANDPLHRSSLFEAGLVLFILTLIVNVIAAGSSSRGPARSPGRGDRRRDGRSIGRRRGRLMSAPQLSLISARRRRTDRVMRGLLVAGTRWPWFRSYSLSTTCSTRDSAPGRAASSAAIPTATSSAAPAASRSAILGSLEIVGLATVIAVPLGIGVALYLVEYGNIRFANLVRYLIDVMTGVPSIMFGLFITSCW